MGAARPALLVRRNALASAPFAVEPARHPGADPVHIGSISHLHDPPMRTQALALHHHEATRIINGRSFFTILSR
ncbi:MAG: hypothetical protein E6J34_17900 [Chloroflexi bacterium]|nr:MAG: hypothetical protein E6J34_17900 [Chloroflexota bacterium]